MFSYVPGANRNDITKTMITDNDNYFTINIPRLHECPKALFT